MNALKGEVVTLIWESDFSEMVSKIYGRPYRFQQQGDMMGQDTIEKFTVPAIEEELYGVVPLNEWRNAEPPHEGDWKEEMRWKREYYPSLEEVVNDLYKRGLIEPGNYALHIWW
jgi:hypothetical protein